jgi:hypothetical protein
LFKLFKVGFVLVAVAALLGAAFVFGRDTNEVEQPSYEIPPEWRAEWESWQEARNSAYISNGMMARFKGALTDLEAFSDSLAWLELKQRNDVTDPDEVAESAAVLERMLKRAEEALVAAEQTDKIAKDELAKAKQWSEDLKSELELRKLLARYVEDYKLLEGEPILPENAPKEDKEKLDTLLEETSQL